MMFCVTRSAECVRGGACSKFASSKTHRSRAPPATDAAGNTSPRMRFTCAWSSSSPLRKNERLGSSAWPNATPMTSPSTAPASSDLRAQLDFSSPSSDGSASASASRQTPTRNVPPVDSTCTSQYAASCSIGVDAYADPLPQTAQPVALDSRRTSAPLRSKETKGESSTPSSKVLSPPRRFPKRQPQHRASIGRAGRPRHAGRSTGTRRRVVPTEWIKKA
mmetsp:Transcript_19087/g.64474  ORF Transcript_19087/g.64474 Transcript_19087/m.64474 type:complete len:220 (+) Transcript_19087:316-975(+)